MQPLTLQFLVELQRRFDRSRGFDALPFRHADPPAADDEERMLRRIEFTTLALAGEVGELANVVKKLRRDGEPKRRAGTPFAAVIDESTDVFAYLLKLFGVIGSPVTVAYLEKLAYNCVRFAANERSGTLAVSIAGPPNSGKTTIAAGLSARFPDWPVYVERFEENPYLAAFIEPKGPFEAYRSQQWFLERYDRFLETLTEPRVVGFDQDPSATTLVYASYFTAMGRLSEHEYADLLVRGAELELRLGSIAPERLVIVLDATPKTLHSRTAMKYGGRQLEIEFVRAIRQRFADVYTGLPNVRVVNTDDLSVEATLAAVSGLIEVELTTRGR